MDETENNGAYGGVEESSIPNTTSLGIDAVDMEGTVSVAHPKDMVAGSGKHKLLEEATGLKWRLQLQQLRSV